MKIHKSFKQNFKPKSFKQKIALLLVALLALAMTGWPGVASADVYQAMIDLKNSGKMSNEYINQSVIDLSSVSQGSVVTYTYMGTAETLTTETVSVLPQNNSSAADKITRFMFNLTNRYQPETYFPLSVSQDINTVNAYVYGTMKDEGIWIIVNGLPDCLGNPPITAPGESGGGDTSWVDQYSPDQIAETIATATFSISSTTLTIADTSISETKTIKMDVAPEVINDRTYVPVRYLAYALGVPEEGVSWDDKTNTASITKDKTTIKMTIGSKLLNVNGKSDMMDVAPYVKEISTGGRTMLPARWVAEPLGAKVGWDEKTQQVTLTSEITTEITKQGQ